MDEGEVDLAHIEKCWRINSKISKFNSKNNRRSYPPTKIWRKNEGVPSSSGTEPFHVSSNDDPHRGWCTRQ